MSWEFKDPPNVSVFTHKDIVSGKDWIYYVSHDADDGAWQFHPKAGPASESESSVVGLRTMRDLDPSIAKLADLPLGWCAWRDTSKAEWKRMKKAV